MGELLGALGLAWPRLLLYPGGLSALLASWLLVRWLAWCTRQPHRRLEPSSPSHSGDLLAPLLALSLLPLAPAASFPHGLDLIVALALLEWPQLRAGLAADDRQLRLQALWPLLLAAAGFAVAHRGLDLSLLLRWPSATPVQALSLTSTTLWLVSLPGLLGPPAPNLALRLRSLGLVLLGGLPLLGALAALSAAHLPAVQAAWLLAALAALVAGGVVGASSALPAPYRNWLNSVLALGIFGLIAWGLAAGI